MLQNLARKNAKLKEKLVSERKFGKINVFFGCILGIYNYVLFDALAKEKL